MAKREVEISAPTFDTLEESLKYSQRFQHPQSFIDEFVKLFKSRIKLSADPKYNSMLLASGSAVISPGRETIKIGRAGLIRDSELFKTLIHSESTKRCGTLGQTRRKFISQPRMMDMMRSERSRLCAGFSIFLCRKRKRLYRRRRKSGGDTPRDKTRRNHSS